MRQIYKELTMQDGTTDGDLYNGFVFYSVDTLRTYVANLLLMFKNIKVRRYASDFITISQLIDVPLHFGSQSKEHYERREDYTSEGGRQSYQNYPNMALVLSGISPSPDRAKSPNAVRYLVSDDAIKLRGFIDSVLADIEPVPYNFDFTLTIRTRKTEDLVQILEQILPYQRASRVLRIREIPFLNMERDINVSMTSLSVELSSEMTQENNRVHTATIGFTLEGFQYSPVVSPRVIKSIYSLVYEQGLTNGTLDKKLAWLLATDKNDIPVDAVEVTEYHAGTWLYKLYSDTE